METSDQETFTVTIKGTGIDVKREVDVSRLALVMTVVMGGAPPEGAAFQASSNGGNVEPAKVSLREFLAEAKSTTKPDQIVAIGHYMAVHEGKEIFSRDDVKERFKSAREPLPANFPRDFSTAIGKGMIAEDHAKAGQYYVTRTGARSVERRSSAQD